MDGTTPFTVFHSAREEQDWDGLYRSSGAVLLGGLVALFLSGAVFLQVVLYWRLYPSDPKTTKGTVVLVWLLDLVHSAMVCAANWENLIANFGHWQRLDYITWPIAVTVALTATTTFLVHCFFSHRIHTLSRRNWYITIPLVILASVRLIAATVSTAEMIRLQSFESFVEHYGYVFTLGLSTSTALDILITGILCYYLRRRRSGLDKMDRIIGILTLYTVENGMLTCITTAISLICWVQMSDNLIFLGLHLAIGKMYANSIMASLNARKSLTTKFEGSLSGEGIPMPVVFPSPYTPRSAIPPWSTRGRPEIDQTKSLQVNIDIEHTIHREVYAQSRDGVGEGCELPTETGSASGDEKAA